MLGLQNVKNPSHGDSLQVATIVAVLDGYRYQPWWSLLDGGPEPAIIADTLRICFDPIKAQFYYVNVGTMVQYLNNYIQTEF